jgi:hypothetical protein
MDLEEMEAKNDSAGEDQQQLTTGKSESEIKTVVPLAEEWEANKSPLLEAVM